MKILIAEDDENSRILLETALFSKGHDVVSAENGKIALERALEDPPDIIISDILMPEMDGYGLCREIKSNQNLSRIPFIFYTATYTDPGDEKFAMSLGAAKFIVKPMEIDLLLDEIENVLEKSSSFRFESNGEPISEQGSFHKKYSEVITKKLDEKVRQLELERKKLKKSEETVRKNLQKLYGILENISLGVVMVNRDMRVVEVNKKMRQWFPNIENKSNSLCYESFNDPPSDGICEYCPVRKTFEDGQVHEEVIKKTIDDELKTYRIISSPIIDEKGVVTAAIEIVEDITERIETERKLDQAQKLEAIGTLAGGIAHDFNNILTSIIGYTELALDDVEKGSMIENDLREIYSAGKRAKDLVHQILQFARKSTHERKPIVVSKVVEEVLSFIRSSIPTTIEIRKEINSNSVVMGDATQIHQIMMNLCTNAAQSMEDEGIISVTLNDAIFDANSAEASSVKEAGEYLELKISDTGKGIPQNILSKIFNPYFTTKEPGEGTGLGLSLVHGIVESYNGCILVRSVKGRGTTFIIYLPVFKSDKQFLLSLDDELPKGDEKILCVDDEKSIGKISGEMLTRLGYSVTVCTDSKKALEIFRENPDEYDLVITDMTMPNMSGDRLAQEIISIKPSAAVILFTGYNRKITKKIASEIGIKELAYKPIIKADLARMVRKVLDGCRKSE